MTDTHHPEPARTKTPPIDNCKILAFASPKGGVGKSTVSLMVASALAYRGYPVHLLDLDQNQTLNTWNIVHQPNIANLTIEPVPDTQFMVRIQQLYHQHHGIILIDIAGAFDKTSLYAATLADITISPAGLDIPDINEAFKLSREIASLAQRVGKPIIHRLLINKVPPLLTATYQKAILDHDIPASGLRRFETMLHARTAYPESFSTGQPPHYASLSREPIRKAVNELDTLVDEILSLLIPAQLPTTSVGPTDTTDAMPPITKAAA